MTSWTCGVCGGRVYGFEGERGHVVGRCKHCGQPYGLSTGVDKGDYTILDVAAAFLSREVPAESFREIEERPRFAEKFKQKIIVPDKKRRRKGDEKKGHSKRRRR